MNAKTFLDSNILIYAYDNSDRLKQMRGFIPGIETDIPHEKDRI